MKTSTFARMLSRAKTRTSFPYGRAAVGVNLDVIRVKAEVFAANNPQPRAMFLLG